MYSIVNRWTPEGYLCGAQELRNNARRMSVFRVIEESDDFTRDIEENYALVQYDRLAAFSDLCNINQLLERAYVLAQQVAVSYSADEQERSHAAQMLQFLEKDMKKVNMACTYIKDEKFFEQKKQYNQDRHIQIEAHRAQIAQIEAQAYQTQAEAAETQANIKWWQTWGGSLPNEVNVNHTYN
jgi:hypothetical protein